MTDNLHERILKQRDILKEIVGLLSLGSNIDPEYELKEIENTVKLLNDIEKIFN